MRGSVRYHNAFQLDKQILEHLGLLLLKHTVLAVESHEVLSQRVQVRVELEQRDLAEVRVVDVRQHVQQVAVDAPHDRRERHREDIACK